MADTTTNSILSTSSINNLISAYTSQENNRQISPLLTRKSKYSTLTDSYTELKSRLNSLENSTKALPLKTDGTVDENTVANTKKITDFVNNFNNAYSYMKSKIVSGKNNVRGIFTGDTTVISIWRSLQSTAQSTINGIQNGDMSYLSQIGITFDTTNGLTIDSTKLKNNLDTNLTQVNNIFNSESGIVKSLTSKLSGLTSSSGVLSSLTNSYNNSINYLDDKITSIQSRIDKSGSVLRKQYEKLQTQLASLLSTQTNWTSYLNSSYF